MINRLVNKIEFARSLKRGKKEKLLAVQEFGDKPLLFPPIFIIGVPRSGSTAFYQAVTNSLNLIYFTNYAIKMYPSILRGMKKHNEKVDICSCSALPVTSQGKV